MSENKQQSKFKKFLSAIDVFSYVPVPQAYPVSSSKSKIGSFIFIGILLGFLIFDFVQFMTKNIPTVNVLEADSINTGNTTVPQFAFGLQYTNVSDDYQTYIFNNPNYFYFVFQSQYIRTQNKKAEVNRTIIPLKKCGDQHWSNIIEQDLICLDLSPQVIASLNLSYPIVNQNGSLIMSETKNQSTGLREDYYFMLGLYYCQNSADCALSTQINDVISNSSLMFFAQQNVGYNYQQGTQISPDEIRAFRYMLNPQRTTLVQLYVTETQFLKFPNYLTGFTTKQIAYSKFTKQSVTNLTYQLSEGLRMMIFPDWVVGQVQIHPVTLLITVSKWSAFASFIFMLSAACFLGYNKRKFRNKNPDWQQFDQVLKTKEIQLQPLSTKTEGNEQQILRTSSISKSNHTKQQKNQIAMRLKLLTSQQRQISENKQQPSSKLSQHASLQNSSSNASEKRSVNKKSIDDSRAIMGQDQI